jgi:hypothetical protein
VKETDHARVKREREEKNGRKKEVDLGGAI